MENRINIVIYTDKYKEDLSKMLHAMSKELFGTGTANTDNFVKTHWCIYLALCEDKVIGFASFHYNTYFGFRDPTVGLTYMYIDPAHRNSRASYLLNIQSGVLCLDNNLSLEHYYASEQSKRMSKRIKGKCIYETYIYEVPEVKEAFSKLISKVNIKDNKHEI